MEKEYVVKLDVYLGVLEARVISFNQLNTGTCKLGFELTSNKQALDLTGKKVTFEVITPSGAILEDAILITDAIQGKCECMLASDMITEQGLHYGEINVYSADHVKMLTFNKFRYLVKEQLGVKNVTVDTRYATLQELIFDVEGLKNQSAIDTEAVTQMKNETDIMHKDVIVKHGEVEVKHQDVVTLAQSVKDDASRTDSNAQQVSTDKGIVTKAKNEVVAKHEEVLRTVAGIAQDKAIVEQAKTEIVGYKNEVEAMKNDVQQLVTDSTEDLILEGNRQVVRVSTEGTTQVNLAKEEVNKATQQATVATEQATLAKTEADKVSGALERLDVKNTEQDNRLTALENNPASNVTLNGEAQTNFNFIENEVVQDGFLQYEKWIGANSKTLNQSTKTIQFKIEILTKKTYILRFGKNSSNNYLALSIKNDKLALLNSSTGAVVLQSNTDVSNYIDGYIYIDNEKIKLFTGKELLEINNTDFSLSNNIFSNNFSSYDSELNNVEILTYNRQLTPQEIQHNFSVLNNSPSIKELHTTDADGKTSILKLASSEDYVEMSTGRTLREEYMGVLKTMGKEFTSADGSPIEVNNGIEARVINAEIKGQTIKNLFDFKTIGTSIADRIISINNCTSNVNGMYLHNITDKTIIYSAYDLNTKEWKKDFVVNGNSSMFVDIDCYVLSITALFKNGWTNSEVDIIKLKNTSLIMTNATDRQIVTSHIPFGLSSTQAIITNNGNFYPIYEPTIQGKTEILNGQLASLEPSDTSLPSLGSVPNGISDYIDRANGVLHGNTYEDTLTGNEEIKLIQPFTNTTRFYIKLSKCNESIGVGGCVCNKLEHIVDYTLDAPHYYIAGDGFAILFINNTDLNGKTPKEYIASQYLNGTPITIRYQLATPIEVLLTDEELHAYDAYKKVILLSEVGDIKDILEFDGNGCRLLNTINKLTFDKVDGWTKMGTYGSYTAFNFNLTNLAITDSNGRSCVCDKLPSISYANFTKTDDSVGEGIYLSDKVARLRLQTSKVDTIEQLKIYLEAEKINVNYLLATPTTTHIPKELVPTILTHKTNIWEVGGAVRASSFKITQPVDRIAEIEARLQALENTTVDVVLNK